MMTATAAVTKCSPRDALAEAAVHRGFPGRNADPRSMGDDELCRLLEHCGSHSVAWRDRCLCLLPEAARRKLYERYSCGSVTQLAAERCGLSPGVVDRVMRLDRRLEAFPRLRRLFERNQVGWTKLEVVMSQVTPENEERWARLVCDATRSRLLSIVQSEMEQRGDEHQGHLKGEEHGSRPNSSFDTRNEQPGPQSEAVSTFGISHHRPAGDGPSEAGSGQGNGSTTEANGPSDRARMRPDAPTRPLQPDLPDVLHEWMSRGPGTGRQAVYLPFDPIEVERMFFEAETLGREGPGRRPLSPTQVVRHFMDHHSPNADSRPRYTEVIYHDPTCDERTMKTTLGQLILTEEDMARRVREGESVDLVALHEVAKEAATAYVAKRTTAGKKVGRYLPAPVRRYLRLRFRGFCATPGCHRHATHDHHLRRHALDATPDPDALAPLCHHHGALAHLRALAGELPPLEQLNRRSPAAGQNALNVEPDQASPPTQAVVMIPSYPGTRQAVMATERAHVPRIETNEPRSPANSDVNSSGLPPLPDLRVVLPLLPETPEELARARIDAKVQQHRCRAILRRTSLEPGVAATAPVAWGAAQVLATRVRGAETPETVIGIADTDVAAAGTVTETTGTHPETVEAATATAPPHSETVVAVAVTAPRHSSTAGRLAGEEPKVRAVDTDAQEAGHVANEGPDTPTVEGCALDSPATSDGPLLTSERASLTNARTPAADARTPAADARTPAADARTSLPEKRASRSEELTSTVFHFAGEVNEASADCLAGEAQPPAGLETTIRTIPPTDGVAWGQEHTENEDSRSGQDNGSNERDEPPD